jgi:hypothetical protein
MNLHVFTEQIKKSVANNFFRWAGTMAHIQQDGKIWGHHPTYRITRITRCGSHTKAGRLKGRAKEHFTQNSYGSVVVKHFGYALAKITGVESHVHWGRKESSKCPHCKETVIEACTYVRNHVSDIIVDVRENSIKAEQIAIGILNSCPLCQRSDQWLGQLSA